MTKIYFQVVKRVLQHWTILQYLRTTQLLRLLWLSVDNNAKVILIASHMLTTWSQRTAVWFSKYKTPRRYHKRPRRSSKKTFQNGTTIQNVKRHVSIMIGLIDHFQHCKFNKCSCMLYSCLRFVCQNFSLGCGSNTDCPERHYCRQGLIQDPAENKTESRCVKASNHIKIISE